MKNSSPQRERFSPERAYRPRVSPPSVEDKDACAIYGQKGKTTAVATIGRDRLSLRVEAALEKGDATALDSILRDQ